MNFPKTILRGKTQHAAAYRVGRTGLAPSGLTAFSSASVNFSRPPSCAASVATIGTTFLKSSLALWTAFIVLCATSSSAALASWYDANGLTCASWSYPLGTKLLVTEIHNGLSVVVTVNDRGPAHRLGRTIDLSRDAFQQIDGLELGVAEVNLAVVSPAKTKP